MFPSETEANNMANRILWAFNPFQKNRRVFKNTVALLKSLAKAGRSTVEPVFVVSPAEAKVVLEFSVPARIRFQTVARRACLRVLRRVRFKGLKPPKILVENHLMISYSAKTLANYASKAKANKIVVGTQAKAGMDRFVLGSFAETLLYFTKVPMILVNPWVKQIAPLRQILFATDFSPDSLSAFKKVCAMALRHDSALTLFHSLPKPFQWAKQAAEFLFGRGMMDVSEYLAIESENRFHEAKPFINHARKMKIPIQFHLEQSDREAGEAILGFAKKSKVNLIALVAHTSRVRSSLLGSTTRGVLREAHVPIWVLRPR